MANTVRESNRFLSLSSWSSWLLSLSAHVVNSSSEIFPSPSIPANFLKCGCSILDFKRFLGFFSSFQIGSKILGEDGGMIKIATLVLNVSTQTPDDTFHQFAAHKNSIHSEHRKSDAPEPTSSNRNSYVLQRNFMANFRNHPEHG